MATHPPSLCLSWPRSHQVRQACGQDRCRGHQSPYAHHLAGAAWIPELKPNQRDHFSVSSSFEIACPGLLTAGLWPAKCRSLDSHCRNPLPHQEQVPGFCIMNRSPWPPMLSHRPAMMKAPLWTALRVTTRSRVRFPGRTQASLKQGDGGKCSRGLQQSPWQHRVRPFCGIPRTQSASSTACLI